MKELEGVGVAMVTPFNADGTVDYSGLEKLTEHLIAEGANYLVVQGTTGESATLNSEEKKKTLQTVKDINNGRLPVVLGIGGNNTAAVIDNIQTADLNGVCAILSASPYYNKPTQEGIYQHYKALSEASPLPIILYNVPGRTASNVTADTCLRLANDCSNIVAVKEASADMDQVMDIINRKKDNFMVLSGEDALTLSIMATGGVGVISVVANAFPGQFSNMINAVNNGDLAAARKNHYLLLEFINMLFAEGNPAGIKSALKALGICNDHLRLPLVPVSEELASKIKNKVDSISNS